MILETLDMSKASDNGKAKVLALYNYEELEFQIYIDMLEGVPAAGEGGLFRYKLTKK